MLHLHLEEVLGGIVVALDILKDLELLLLVLQNQEDSTAMRYFLRLHHDKKNNLMNHELYKYEHVF